MNRNTITTALAALATIGLFASAARAADLNLGPIQPANPGFGQSAQFNVYLSNNGKPVKGARIECWFSGIKGIQTLHWIAVTNAQGRASFTKTIPRNWKGASWVDLNASCESEGVLKLWRVRGK